MRIIVYSLITFCVLAQYCYGQGNPAPPYSIQIWHKHLTPTSHELLPYLFKLQSSPETVPQLAPELIALLAHENETVRILAMRALRGAGPNAKPAVESLIRMLNHPDYTFRIEVVNTLKSIGPDAIPKLMEALNSDTLVIKSHSLSVLNHLTQVESSVLEQLEKEADIQLRVCVAQAWAKHGKLGVTKLGPLCQDKDTPVAVAAIESLKYNYSDPNNAISNLRQCLPNADTWPIAVTALQSFGVEAQVALPDIVNAFPSEANYNVLEEQNGKILNDAIYHIGPASINDLKQLRTMLSHSNLFVRATAAGLIGQLGPAAKIAAADLATAFSISQREQKHLVQPEQFSTEEVRLNSFYQDLLHLALQLKAADAFWMVSRDTLAYAKLLEEVLDQPDLNFSFPQTQSALFTNTDIEILGQLLDHNNPVVRSNIARSFRSISTSHIDIKHLQKLRELSEPRSIFYSHACYQIDQATETQILAWLREDFDNNSISLDEAISFLRYAKISLPHFDALIREELNARNIHQKTNALVYLVEHAETDKEAAELVLGTVRKDWHLRPTALRLLLHRTYPSSGVIEFAERSLNSSDPGVVGDSLSLLIRTAPANPSLISMLETRIEKFRTSEDSWRFDLTLYAIAYLKKEKTVIEAESRSLLSLDETTRHATFCLISKLGDASGFFLEDIRNYLEEAATRKSDRTERLSDSLRLLGSLGSDQARELLQQYSRDRDWPVRTQASSILQALDAGLELSYDHEVY